MGHSDLDPAVQERRPRNAGQNLSPKRTIKRREILAMRFYLDEHKRLRDRALFDMAIDSTLRGQAAGRGKRTGAGAVEPERENNV